MYNWDDVRDRYSSHCSNHTNVFNYTKLIFFKIASFLPFILTDTLAIFSHDQAFCNMFWNEFYLCQPINEVRKLSKIVQHIN